MFQVVTRSAQPERGTTGTARTGRRALELVGMRGRDVLGVRHVLDGGRAWVGNVAESVAKIAMTEYGGQPLVIGEVTDGTCRVLVPARARLRMHGADGLGRIARGPCAVALREGDKAVVVLGKISVRAQVVSVDLPPRAGLRFPTGAAGWIAFVGALYVAVLTLCAALSPTRPARLERHLRPAVEARIAPPALP